MHTLKSFIVIFLALVIVSCVGRPDPSASGPTSEKPIFFMKPTANEVVPVGEPIEVYLALDAELEFSDLSLFVDGREVRLVNEFGRFWSANHIDDALLVLTPGEHLLKAVVVTEDGKEFTRSQKVFAGQLEPIDVGASIDARITEVEIVNVDSGRSYSVDFASEQATLAIPAEDLLGAELNVNYQGDIFSITLYGDFLEESTYLFAEDKFSYLFNEEKKRYLYGSYQLLIRPHSIVGGDTVSLPYEKVEIEVLDSALKVSTRVFDLVGSLQSNESGSYAKVIIENLGNREAAFEFRDVPDWLTLGALSGVLEAGEAKAIEIAAGACEEQLVREAELVLVSETGSNTIYIKRTCVDGPVFDLSLERFYFNQSVAVNDSSRPPENRVEAVKGRAGLARAFVTASDDSDFLPVVRLVYRTADDHEGFYDLVGPAVAPVSIFEGRLDNTFNAALPASFFEAGTQYYVVIDPDNEITERLENNNRYPASGYLPLTVRDTPPLKVTFVPMYKSGDGDAPVFSQDDVELFLSKTMALMPLENYEVSVREQPYSYTRSTWSGVLSELDTLRELERAEGVYYGLVPDALDEDYGGMARIGGQVSVSVAHPEVIAHELGHNFGLRHVNCGEPKGPDPAFPHELGQIDLWGYNLFTGALKEPAYFDFMSYCDPSWISAYHYRKILSFRGGSLTPQPTDIPQNKLYVDLDEKKPDDFLVLNGTLYERSATLENIYQITGATSDVSPSGLFNITLYDNSGASFYAGWVAADDISHSDTQLFSAKIPLSSITEDIARIVIAKGDSVYLDEKWRVLTANTFQALMDSVQVTRIDDKKVAVSWSTDGAATLTVKDPRSTSILALDKTGEVIVFSEHDNLEISITINGISETEIFTAVDGG